ncbi:uncharacterized protein RJT20DRAFT_131988 [Scheffersomyces xylosifermentans]|uniref:uncharacterized protein n=1 Tax=Scheffersomyces xylosifermentans TaxID=1304137 RepID=UPI00315D8B17
MRIGFNWAFIALFIGLTSAVLLEDAFSKEMVNHIYHQFTSYDVVNGDSIVGYTGYGQFIAVKLSDPSYLDWTIDLKQLPFTVDKYQLAKNNQLVYLYSTAEAELFLFDAKSGIFVRSVELSSPPVQIENFFNKGILLLDQSGSIVYVDHTTGSVKVVKKDLPQVANYFVDQRDGFSYAIVGAKIITITSKAEVVATEELPFNDVKDFKDGIAVTTDDQVYKFDTTNVPEKITISNLKNLHVINSKYLYSSDGDKYFLNTITDENTLSIAAEFKADSGLLNIGYHQFALGDFWIITEKTGRKFIYDLTDLLILEDLESLKLAKTKQDQLFSDDFITSLNGNLVLVTVDPNVEGRVYNVQDGTLYKVITSANQYSATNNDYLIIDKPESEQTINEFHHLLEDADSGLVLLRWLRRVKRHLGELGKYIVSFASQENDEQSVLASEGDEFGFGKLIIFYDDVQQALIAINSIDGKLVWKSTGSFSGSPIKLTKLGDDIVALFTQHLYYVNSRDGAIIDVQNLSGEPTDIFPATLEDELDVLILKKEGQFTLVEGPKDSVHDLYLVDHDNESVSGHKIVAGQSNSFKTWKFAEDNEEIVEVVFKPFETRTSSLGISLANKDVLYKYLNPNAVSVLTKDSANGQLKFYLLDGITGTLLSTFEHDANTVIDFSSINIIMDDNWVVYSYFVSHPKLEQRINVIDFFDSDKGIKKGIDSVSPFRHNSTVDSFTVKSFLFPERIISLASTQSQYGITLKSIIAATETGAVIEIPKFLLNSRRIDDRELTQADFQSDFRMVPYEPVIQRNSFSVLNHKHKLKITEQGKILTRPTHFESTSVVCYFNEYNQFCTTVQPSSSFDLLSKNFDRIKLLLTIAILLAGYLISKPFVFNKKLNAQWIDSP